MRTSVVILGLLAPAACGDGHSTSPDASVPHDTRPIDGTPDVPPDTQLLPIAIPLRYISRDELAFAYRDGDGPWQPLSFHGPFGNTTILVTDKYEVVLACGTAAGHGTTLYRGTTSDPGTPFVFCNAPRSPVPGGGDPHVRGTMLQPGTVSILDPPASATGPWQFDLTTPNGTDDLFAFDDARMVVRRDLDTSTDVTVPDIDLATEGTPLESAALSLTNLDPDELVHGYTTFYADLDFATISESESTTLKYAPASLLETNDVQFIDLYADLGDTERSIDLEPGPGMRTTLTLMPRLADILWTTLGASWTALPDGDIYYQIYGTTTTDRHELLLQASPAWRGTATSIAADFTGVPGYDLAWLPDSAHSTRYFAVTNNDALGVSYSTSIDGSVGSLLGRFRPHLERPDRARRQARVASRRILP